MAADAAPGAAFLLVYLTFFLDNVLLTVLVPVLPDWVDENATLPLGSAGSPAVAGLVLGGKAAAQFVTAPLAGAAAERWGGAMTLRAGTALLAAAAGALATCAGPWGAGGARLLHGGGAALCGVGGAALCARVVTAEGGRRRRALGALLGAVALGVLVGYPVGGAAAALRCERAPFLVLAGALLADLGLQHHLLGACTGGEGGSAAGGYRSGWRGLLCASRAGCAGWGAGCVLVTTSVMAALEPCLPVYLWSRWGAGGAARGLVFLPDSAGYLLASTVLGGSGLAARLGLERVALSGAACVGVGALGAGWARSPGLLAVPHALLGLGLGAADAALVPALVGGAGRGGAAHAAALLQAAGSAAYALGPALGGALAARVGFPATMRLLGAANLLYALQLRRVFAHHPLPAPGADTLEEEDDEEGACELTAAATYARLP